MDDTTSQSLLRRRIEMLVVFVLLALPFHAFFTTWLGSTFGHIDLFRIWKELILWGVFPFVLVWAIKDAAVRTWLKTDTLPRLLAMYVLLHLITGLFALRAGRVNSEALIYALLINLRYFGACMICFVLAYQSPMLQKYKERIIVLPALVVIAFGVLQVTVLPLNFLSHFGYGPETIPAYQTVDQKESFQRIQSFTRGANPLGAYLVFVLPILWLALRNLPRRLRLGMLGVGVAVLFFTYSRSAWIGGAVVLALLLGTRIKRSMITKQLVAAICVCCALFAGGVYVLRDQSFVQNTLFHTDETTKSTESSNAGRLRALQTATGEVIREPFGQGPGTAGPASFRNEKQQPRIAENYYIQLAQELGWVGVVLYGWIVYEVLRRLWVLRSQQWPWLMFVTFCGISAINMVSHAWTDDTLAILWWGIAGVVLSPAILRQKRKHKPRDTTQKITA